MTENTKALSDAGRRAWIEILIVIAVSGAAYAIELAAADVLPWGNEARGVIAVLAVAITAVALSLRHGGRLSDLGFLRPRRWWTIPFWVLGIMVVFIIAQGLVPQLVTPLFDLRAPDMSRYDFIRGNAGAAIAMALLLPLTAAIPEEIVYRGFLIGRLIQLFGNSRAATLLAVLVQSLIFGLIHFQWGIGGIVFSTIMGIVWGGAYLLCGRNLWIVILAHSAAHIALVAQLYSLPPAA